MDFMDYRSYSNVFGVWESGLVAMNPMVSFTIGYEVLFWVEIDPTTWFGDSLGMGFGWHGSSP